MPSQLTPADHLDETERAVLCWLAKKFEKGIQNVWEDEIATFLKGIGASMNFLALEGILKSLGAVDRCVFPPPPLQEERQGNLIVVGSRDVAAHRRYAEWAQNHRNGWTIKAEALFVVRHIESESVKTIPAQTLHHASTPAGTERMLAIVRQIEALCKRLNEYSETRGPSLADVKCFLHPPTHGESQPSIGYNLEPQDTSTLCAVCAELEPLLCNLGASVPADGKTPDGRVLAWAFNVLHSEKNPAHDELNGDPFISISLAATLWLERARSAAGDGPAFGQANAENAARPTKKPKRSTERGEGRAKIIAALVAHHRYENGRCLNLAPIGNNELARTVGVSESTASAFFEKEFKGHAKYRATCNDPPNLVAALKLLNGEYSPHLLYGANPPGDGPQGDE